MQLPIVVVVLWFDGIEMFGGEDGRSRNCVKRTVLQIMTYWVYIYLDTIW